MESGCWRWQCPGFLQAQQMNMPLATFDADALDGFALCFDDNIGRRLNGVLELAIIKVNQHDRIFRVVGDTAQSHPLGRDLVAKVQPRNLYFDQFSGHYSIELIEKFFQLSSWYLS